jgi:hypothetical protein
VKKDHRETRDLKVGQVSLVDLEDRENADLLVPRDNLVLKDLRVHLDLEVCLARMVSVVPRVTLEQRDRKGPVEIKDPWETMANPELREHLV